MEVCIAIRFLSSLDMGNCEWNLSLLKGHGRARARARKV